jgi:hypothetical protein
MTRPRCVFNAANYIAGYPDLQAAYNTNYAGAKTHYMKHGLAERRSPCGKVVATCFFDPATYLRLHPDLYSEFGFNLAKATVHYNTTGINEGRTVCVPSVCEMYDVYNGQTQVRPIRDPSFSFNAPCCGPTTINVDNSWAGGVSPVTNFGITSGFRFDATGSGSSQQRLKNCKIQTVPLAAPRAVTVWSQLYC